MKHSNKIYANESNQASIFWFKAAMETPGLKIKILLWPLLLYTVFQYCRQNWLE